MSTTPRLGFRLLASGQVAAEVDHNNAMLAIDQFCFPSVLSRQATAPGGSEVDGDAYLVAATATGDFTGHEDEIAYLKNGAWQFVVPKVGFVVFVTDEEVFVHYRYNHGTAQNEWTDDWHVAGDLTSDGFARHSAAFGITASTTQTQGQQPLTKEINRVDTVANANDVVTLPDDQAGGMQVVVRNAGANTLQVFPASGGTIDGGATNASVTIAAGATRIFFNVDVNTWISVLGA